ncbi:MAG: nucleoside triphosphate pyrophosphohydrolase [Candidatus Gastranaerophilales bacterium]|nr:nucleoside triphosphate pyrophosphohydrolase [Candidatus Gastranaerophilales bacterium]
MSNYPNLEELIKVIETLRSENGCAWDREQTHSSLKRNMLEEAYEAVDAIDNNDSKHLQEELGDVLLQVILHSQIAKEDNEFNIEDVADNIKTKLIHRHPHVFGDVKVKNTQEILDNWEKLKKQEKPHRTSLMDGVSKSQAALMSAQKISKKAVTVGFEWQNEQQLLDCVHSELQEFQEAQTKEHKEEELGDLLFAIVNLARWNKIDAEQALLKANKKFIKRFKTMEVLCDKNLSDNSFEEWDCLWKKAKKQCLKDSD